MSRNPDPGPPAGTLIISALVILNAIVLKQGYITDHSDYWWLTITVPLLVIAIFSTRRHPACRSGRWHNK